MKLERVEIENCRAIEMLDLPLDQPSGGYRIVLVLAADLPNHPLSRTPAPGTKGTPPLLDVTHPRHPGGIHRLSTRAG